MCGRDLPVTSILGLMTASTDFLCRRGGGSGMIECGSPPLRFFLTLESGAACGKAKKSKNLMIAVFISVTLIKVKNIYEDNDTLNK